MLAYDTRVILDSVNLTIEDGETLVILGGSGSGKSTLLRLDYGFTTPPHQAKLLLMSVDITTLSEEEFNRYGSRWAWYFNTPLFYSMSVGENVAFGLREHTNLSDDKIQHIVDGATQLGWVKRYESYMPNELSGGMKKGLVLLEAIALDPTLILYDEPSSGLDPITSGTISMLIRGMQERLGCTSIM